MIETRTWFGHELESIVVEGAAGQRVPCHILRPHGSGAPVPFVLATHGATSSKHEWTEIDGYTKGGNLSRELLAAGVAVVAMDWHYHGDNDTAELNGRNVFEPRHFGDFFERSVKDAQAVLEWARQNPALDAERMGFAGYSMAGLFGFWLTGHGADFKTMLLCVPGSGRKANESYSPCNNLDHLGTVSILQISAAYDEYIEPEESNWLFSRIPVANKKFLSYPSGHSLPVDYVPEAARWIATELSNPASHREGAPS